MPWNVWIYQQHTYHTCQHAHSMRQGCRWLKLGFSCAAWQWQHWFKPHWFWATPHPMLIQLCEHAMSWEEEITPDELFWVLMWKWCWSEYCKTQWLCVRKGRGVAKCFKPGERNSSESTQMLYKVWYVCSIMLILNALINLQRVSLCCPKGVLCVRYVMACQMRHDWFNIFTSCLQF